MKRIFILVCAVVSVLTDSSCDIADGMKTMRECCVTPNHSNFMLERLCQQIVSVKSKVEQHERAIECYLNMTNLIKNETINKAAVIKIYENNAMFDPEWSQQIREGVDKCSFDSSGTLEHNLLKFYNCVDDFLGENCVNVLQIPECESVQEFYENCKHIQPNCTSWPRSLANPEVCCKIPKVLSNNLYSKCQMECQRKELFIQRQTECTHNCTFLESGLMVEGKFNFAVVKKMLSENANNTELWEKSIEVAVETCEKTVKGKKM